MNKEDTKSFLLPEPEDIKNLRKKANLTQTQLANLAGLSQSLIARIENGTVNPTLSTIKIILSILYKEEKTGNDTEIDEILTKDLIYASSDDSIDQIIEKMNEKNISQLPVSDNKGKIIGSISEKKIMAHLTNYGRNTLTNKVSTVIEPKFPEFEKPITLKQINRVLMNNPAIIIKSNKKIYGIITKSDLLKYYKKSG